jgi:hypothetical protein
VSESERSTPADRFLDLFVFAPAGLALILVEELPSLVEKGRNRIEGQAATARVIGQFAVQIGCREVVKRARQLVDPEQPQRRPSSSPAKQPEVAEIRREDVPESVPDPRDQQVRAPDAPTAHEHTGGPTEGHTEINGFAALGDLAIPAYDTLSASQVVKRLDGLSREELIEVGEHERQNRHRATILAKVEQLLDGEPSVGA